jgi:hypothetical protein
MMNTQEKIELLGKINRLRKELSECLALCSRDNDWSVSERWIAKSLNDRNMLLGKAVERIKTKAKNREGQNVHVNN